MEGYRGNRQIAPVADLGCSDSHDHVGNRRPKIAARPIQWVGLVRRRVISSLSFNFSSLSSSDFHITGTRPVQDFLDPALEKLVLLRKLCEMCT